MAAPGQDNTTSFFDWCVGACVFGAVDIIVQNRPLLLLLGSSIGALFFHLLKVYWVGIRNTFPQITALFERVVLNPRFRRSIAISIVGCFVISGMVYLHSLRRDLDLYVMPRNVSQQQAHALQEYLSHYQSHSVIIKENPLDQEADYYGHALVRAFQETNWDATLDISDKEPHILNPGLCIQTVGSEPVDSGHPNNTPSLLLSQALRAAEIEPNCGGGDPQAGEYKLYIVVGQRPLSSPDEESIISRIGHWFARKKR